MTFPVQQRCLVLLRHAKSAWPHGVPDHERPLAGKGRRNAHATGEWFLSEGPKPDLVLCSDAVRARHTWEIVASVLRPAPPVRVEPAIYGADPDDLLAVLRGLPADRRTVVVVGHEPTMSQTCSLLAGPGSDLVALGRIRSKFPTNGVAVLRTTVPWVRLAPGTAVLERFAVPRT
ncbi:MAG: SixA phosphatase family protein [Kineosporiaceae bacterium]|jgi:phosphohistidine phosphatase